MDPLRQFLLHPLEPIFGPPGTICWTLKDQFLGLLEPFLDPLGPFSRLPWTIDCSTFTAGAKRGVIFLQLTNWSPPDNPFQARRPKASQGLVSLYGDNVAAFQGPI